MKTFFGIVCLFALVISIWGWFQTSRLLRNAQAQAAQCAAQLAAAKAKPARNPVAGAVGAVLGLPPGVAEAAAPMLEHAQENAAQAGAAQAAAASAGHDTVVRYLLSPQGCGGDADCIVKRMCAQPPVTPPSCRANDVACWRGVLEQCGAF